MSDPSLQRAVSGMSMKKSRDKIHLFLHTLFAIIRVFTVALLVALLFSSMLILGLEGEKGRFVSELDNTVCDKSDSDLSRTYRTRTSEELRQNMTEAEFIEQARKVRKICDYLENNSALTLYSQFTFVGSVGRTRGIGRVIGRVIGRGNHSKILVSFDYDGLLVFIRFYGNRKEGFKIERFLAAEHSVVEEALSRD